MWAGICIVSATRSMRASGTIIDQRATTFDTDTTIAWLDLTEAVGKSYKQVVGGYGNYIADGYPLCLDRWNNNILCERRHHTV